MRKTSFLLSLGLLLALAACDKDQPVAPVQPEGIYTITGKLQFDKPIQIPANARVLVGWNVSSGSPDYIYLVGEGRVNMADSTFKIVYKEDLPADALNRYGLGVGAIIVTTDQTIKTGEKYFGDLDGEALGLAEDYGVIYIKGSPDSVASGRAWAKDFKTGFNVGRGVRKQGGFDAFEPADSASVKINIDDVKNLRWVNWT